ncbi:unnamed protein product [Paramecium pentaurelia]|uniref:Cytochrome c oxidase assembly protein n=1 Tax=Paramecium pentaurelia TaxID=43138 RepID=A0A8S1XXK7_9CILI|nr:unnamed protein product [Paramecium pentaurelia]
MFKLSKLFYSFKHSSRSNIQHNLSDFKKKRRQELLYNIGLYGAAFGCAFGAVPFYRLWCEHFGLEGDYDKKDYSMKGKKLDVFRKYHIEFGAETDPEANWEFLPVQQNVTVHAGETALVFYRAYNRNDQAVVGFATYQIFPEDAGLYFAKIQCFCFNQQLLNPKEELQLPIYFYLEPEINEDPLLKKCEDIKIMYKFYKAKNQELAQLAENEYKTVKKNKMILQKLRDAKKSGELSDGELKKIKSTKFTDQEIEDFDEWAYDNPLEAAEAQKEQQESKN